MLAFIRFERQKMLLLDKKKFMVQQKKFSLDEKAFYHFVWHHFQNLGFIRLSKATFKSKAFQGLEDPVDALIIACICIFLEVFT